MYNVYIFISSANHECSGLLNPTPILYHNKITIIMMNLCASVGHTFMTLNTAFSFQNYCNLYVRNNITVDNLTTIIQHKRVILQIYNFIG